MKPAKHTHIPALPFIHSFLGARLDAIRTEISPRRQDLVVDYHEFVPIGPAQITAQGGQILEHVQGLQVPARVRFMGIRKLQSAGLFQELDRLPVDHPLRRLYGLLSWIAAGDNGLFTLFMHGSAEPAELWVLSDGCVAEHCRGIPEPYEFHRAWSPPPPFRPGLIPLLKRSRQQYGGDPVSFHLGARIFHHRLFVGDLESQSQQRPQVDAVLNVGEEPSRWTGQGQTCPSDLWVVRGEGQAGMTPQELTEAANWVIARLERGQRVLIHCVAGLNRSTTVCCAVLILLEGLSAETALERVREHHGWARPDAHHWLVLKWLAQSVQL